jgi:hypothetical protein
MSNGYDAEAFAEQARTDVPCIDSAVKNLLSKLFAEGLVVDDKKVEQAHLMLCARALLKGFNAHEMRTSMVWGAANPQAAEQSGFDRIEQVSQYKVS